METSRVLREHYEGFGRFALFNAMLLHTLPVQIINWKDHLLKEPEERVREARPNEEVAIFANLERGYDVAVEFAMATGARRREIVLLEWTAVDWFNDRITLHGKGDMKRVVPMTPDIRELLWAQKDHHPTRGLHLRLPIHAPDSRRPSLRARAALSDHGDWLGSCLQTGAIEGRCHRLPLPRQPPYGGNPAIAGDRKLAAGSALARS
ncbi:MAG: hypothetical protein E5W89_01390 [Mesorhizobium sp.]|nr:tyrosine-type recombinase/integrase [Mesorhizobium sp.]TIS92986.1 MAG: hypothetical protein E5W89_01390 [Mesorhizobium sp.]